MCLFIVEIRLSVSRFYEVWNTRVTDFTKHWPFIENKYDTWKHGETFVDRDTVETSTYRKYQVFNGIARQMSNYLCVYNGLTYAVVQNYRSMQRPKKYITKKEKKNKSQERKTGARLKMKNIATAKRSMH